jgi:uncharacterized protein YhjY with autotransporter beta-barrel domain
MIGKDRRSTPLALLAGGLFSIIAPTTAMAQVAPSPNTSKLVAAADGNSQWASTAAYIGALCPNLAVGSDLRLRCGAALTAAATNPTQANMALDAITPEQVLAQGGVIDGSIRPATSAVASRLSALSHIGFGRGLAMAYQPVLLATNGDTAGLGGLNAPRLQGYFNIVGGSGSRADNSLETGYDFDQKSITGGADYRFSDKLTAGVSLSYGDTNMKFASNTGKMDASTWMGTVYGLWSPTDRIEVTGLAGYGRVDYSSDRHMDYAESATSTIDRIAHGDTKGTQWEGSLTAAYAMTAAGGWSYGPSLAVSATKLDLDGFNETGADGLDLSYAKQSSNSLQFTLGFDVSKAISISTGVVSPYGRVQAIYEAQDDKRNVIVHYVADTTGFFPGIRLTTLSPDRMRFMLGGGLAGQFAHGWAGFADIETVVGLKDVSGYTATLGLRKEF